MNAKDFWSISKINLLAWIVGIAIFNCMMIYGLLWGTYVIYLDRPELSHIPCSTRHFITNLATLLHIVLLLIATLWMFIIFIKSGRFLWSSAIFSIVSMIVIWHLAHGYYPNSQYQYLQNGHQYRVQIWWMDGENIYKRFKSEQPFTDIVYEDSIIWDLDSLSSK